MNALIILAIVLGVPLLYCIYTLIVILRLSIEVASLRRRCAPRGLRVTWRLFTLFPVDYADPITGDVTIFRGERCFSFTLFFTSTTRYRFTRVKVSPLVVLSYLAGRIAVEPKDLEGESVYMPEGRVEVHTFGDEATDARFRLREETPSKIAPDKLALFCAAITHPDVQAELVAFGGSLAFEYGGMSVYPAARDQPFLDGIERLARLADALDAATKVPGPYR